MQCFILPLLASKDVKNIINYKKKQQNNKKQKTIYKKLIHRNDYHLNLHLCYLQDLLNTKTEQAKKKYFKNIFHEFFFFVNWRSLHARLNSHYEAWSYKKKKQKD